MRIVIIGRSEMLYDTAINLAKEGHELVSIVTATEAPEYRRTANDFEVLAKQYGVPFFKTAKVENIGKIAADIGVSINYPSVIPQSFIDNFRLGILNGHGGDLPRYRGNACHGWAILNGELRTAATVHRMVGGELDSGDIVAREYFSINEHTKITEIISWTIESFPVLFDEAIKNLEKDSNFYLERQKGVGRRCYPILPEDGAIDWSQSALQIIRIINASSHPFAGAYCFDECGKVTIWDAELVRDDEEFLAFPGQVTKRGVDFVEVATGDGKIRILDMTLPFDGVRSIRKRFRNGSLLTVNSDNNHL